MSLDLFARVAQIAIPILLVLLGFWLFKLQKLHEKRLDALGEIYKRLLRAIVTLKAMTNPLIGANHEEVKKVIDDFGIFYEDHKIYLSPDIDKSLRDIDKKFQRMYIKFTMPAKDKGSREAGVPDEETWQEILNTLTEGDIPRLKLAFEDKFRQLLGINMVRFISWRIPIIIIILTLAIGAIYYQGMARDYKVEQYTLNVLAEQQSKSHISLDILKNGQYNLDVIKTNPKNIAALSTYKYKVNASYAIYSIVIAIIAIGLSALVVNLPRGERSKDNKPRGST